MCLKAASASFFPGETVALLGPSGAGKSTLLHIAGLLERPDSGEVLINGVDCVGLSDKEQTRMRRMEVGFVYQFHHLLPEFSALENVVLPQLILGLTREPGRGAREGAARLARPCRALGPPAGAAFRRRAAARRDRPRACQRAESAARRRADRQSRSADRRARVRAASEAHTAVGRGRAWWLPTISTSPPAWTARLRLSDGLLVEETVAVIEVAER